MLTSTDNLYQFTTKWIVRDSVLYIQGTHRLSDWRVNLDFRVGRNTGIHAGYIREYANLRRSVDWSQVREVHGHSMGGALAQIVAMKFPNLSCYGYGAPRIFQSELTLSNLTLVVGNLDPVPLVPPWFKYPKCNLIKTTSLDLRKFHTYELLTQTELVRM